jgi:hypothetical protein
MTFAAPRKVAAMTKRMSSSSSVNFRTYYWFTLNDGTAPAAAQLNFGLYHGDGTPKPAAAAYTDVIRSGRHG